VLGSLENAKRVLREVRGQRLRLPCWAAAAMLACQHSRALLACQRSCAAS
jgi:hypothetical protein